MPSIGWPFSLNIIDHPGSAIAKTSVERIPAGRKNDPQLQVATGIAYSPDGRLLYDATGDTGAIHIFSTATWKRVAEVPLDGVTAGKSFAQSYSAAVALSPDGRLLYVLDQANWRVVVIDTASRRRIASLPTGANPYAVALSPDATRLYITNSGLFEYKTLPGADKKDILHSGVGFPPFGYPSKAARKRRSCRRSRCARTGQRERSARQFALDLQRRRPCFAEAAGAAEAGRIHWRRIARAPRRPRLGGASPTGVVANGNHVYVSLAHEDSIAVIAADGNKLLDEIPLTPFSGADFLDRRGRPLRGIMPAGLALRGQRLYVAEAGIDAVAVIDTGSHRILGHMPVGWYPTAAAVSPDGTLLYVANTKGKGSGPNGGSALPPGKYRQLHRRA